MPSSLIFENFSDLFYKDIEDGGSNDVGHITFNRPYSFSSSASFSFSTQNIFTHTWDYSIFPQSFSPLTGFGIYASQSNSFSGYYYTTEMKLFNFRELQDWNGLFSITTSTASVSSTFYQINKFNPDFNLGNINTYATFTASVTSFYIYSFDRHTYGDKIYDGSLSLYLDSVLIAYDTPTIKNNSVYALTSNLYNDTATSVTRFWVMPDVGQIILWSSDPLIFNALSGVNNIQFKNSVGISNSTMNLYLDPSEFNMSENPSFYLQDFSYGQLPDTFITTIGLYSPWNDLLAVCKLQKPLRKNTNIPITIKISADFLG